MPDRMQLLVMCLVSLSIQPVANAHNGRAFIATPVSGITIDGDLSDWPSEMASHPISIAYLFDGKPETDDFTGRFRVACNYAENSIYVSVSAKDDAVILERVAGPAWSSRDAAEMFLVLEHSDRRIAPFQFVYRNTPLAAIADEPNDAAAEAMTAARATRSGQLNFEWRIDIGKLSNGRHQLAEGCIFGFDVGYIDRDSPSDVSVFSSSSGSAKHMDSFEHADLIIPRAGQQLVRIVGRTAWTSRHSIPPALVQIRSMDRGFFVQTPASKDGTFACAVPPGDYSIVAMDERSLNVASRRVVSVQEDRELDRPLALDFEGDLDALVTRQLDAQSVPGAAFVAIEA